MPISMPVSSNFQSIIEAQAQQDKKRSASLWLSRFRKNAHEKFAQLSAPTMRSEEYRYTSMKEVVSTVYDSVAQSGVSVNYAPYVSSSEHRYVFVDGKLAKTENPTTQAEVGSLFGSLDSDLLQQSLTRSLAGGYFQQLNNMCFSDGAYVSVPAGATLSAPIHLLYISTTPNLPVFYRNIVELQAGSHAKIIETHLGADSAVRHFTNACTQLVLQPNADCLYVKVQNEGCASNHLSIGEFRQLQNSSLRVFALSHGGRLARIETEVKKEGQQTNCDYRFAYFGRDKQVLDCSSQIKHLHPAGKTKQLVRGIVKEQARGVFSGNIFVHRQAQQTSASQLSKNMLIGGDCSVYVRPQLQIIADDVECSHGATSTKLDKASLFYLQTRGIKEQEAVRLLGNAHINALLDEHADRELLSRFVKIASNDYFSKEVHL